MAASLRLAARAQANESGSWLHGLINWLVRYHAASYGCKELLAEGFVKSVKDAPGTPTRSANPE